MTETVLYNAASETDAQSGATALEDAGPLAVEPATDLEKVERYAPGVDCVVFAETPTTAEGAQLLEVIEACGSTPLILFSAGEYGPTAARSTDGIDGYIRREGERAVTHLADEVVWTCADTRDGSGRRTTLEGLHELTTQMQECETEREVFERASEAATELLACEDCGFLTVEEGNLRRRIGTGESSWDRPLVAGVASEALAREEAILIEDVRTDPLTEADPDGWRSLVAVAVGSESVFRAVADRPGAFDERDLKVAEVLAAGVAETIARRRAETGGDCELFENLATPIARYELLDGEPIVREVNDAFEAVFGFGREAIVGENVDEYVVPSELAEEAAALNEAFIDGTPRQHVTRRRTEEGLRDFLVDVVPVDDGGEGFSIYTDVTETKRRERELAARNERLDEFASIVSHDLQNPLNVAEGYLELATETGDLEHLAEVRRAHDRMGELLERLLSLARQGDVIAETEPVAVCDIARRAWSTVDTGEAELEFGEDAILEADKARLIEIFENLLRNSIDHGGKDDDLTVRVGTTEDGFFLEDDGVGIPEGEREAVFESGYTTDPDGTGYGLDIVERIAQAHGWTVEVCESEAGDARFEFAGVEMDVLETRADAGGPIVDV